MGFKDYQGLFVGDVTITAGYRGETRLFGGDPTVPEAFSLSGWDVTTGNAAGYVHLVVAALPASGGSPITAIEYTLNGGAGWATLGGSGTGLRELAMAGEGVSYTFALRAVNAVGVGPVSESKTVTSGAAAATVPAAFGTAGWSVATGSGNGGIVLTVSALPADGGQPIAALEYSVDAGVSWAALEGTGTGARALTMATAGTAYAVLLRAVNEIGAGPASGPKTATSGQLVAAAAISMTQLVANRVYQRSTTTGGLLGKGEGTVMVSGTAAGAVSALAYRLRDADTGDVVVDWTTGVSNVATGAFSVPVPVPAAARFWCVDLRPDGDDSRIVLGTARFAMGRVVLGVGQSQLGRMFGKVDTEGGKIADLVPSASRFGVVRGIYTGNSMQESTSAAGWLVPADGSAYASTGAPEFLRRQVSAHGVACAFVGYGLSGGRVAQLAPGGSASTAMRALIDETGAWEAFWFYAGGSDITGATTEVAFTTNLTALLADVAARNGYGGTVTKVFTATGTRTSETMAQVIPIRRAVAAMAAAEGGTWFEPRDTALYDAVHPSQVGNVTLGAGLHRAFAGGGSQPELVSATRQGTVITLDFTTSNGAMMAVSGNPTGRVGVYPAGATTGGHTVSSVTASGTQVTVTLASDPGADVDLWLYPHPDSAALLSKFIGDSYTADGYAAGRPVRATTTAVTIAAGTTTATAPGTLGTADWSVATGTGDKEVTLTVTALPATGGSAITALQYTLDGGTTWTALTGTGTGARTLTMAAAGAAYTVALRAVNAVGAGAASAGKTVTSGVAAQTGTSWELSHDFAAEDSGALNGMAADTGQVWTAPTTAQVVNGVGLWATGGAANAFNAYSGADLSVEGKFVREGASASGGAPWILARVDAAGTSFYQIGTNQGGSQLRIGKTVGGTYTVITSLDRTAPAAGTQETWRFELEGTALRFYVDGVLKLSASDTAITAAGRVGLRNSNGDTSPNINRWKLLRAAPLASAPTA